MKLVVFRISGSTPPSAAGSLTSAAGTVPIFTPASGQSKNISASGKNISNSGSQSAAADFGEKVFKQTENRLVGMAVGSIAR